MSSSSAKRSASTFRAAVVQAEPVLNDTAETVAHAVDRIAEAAREGARLIVFPEAFLGGYPKGADFGITLGSRTLEGREAFALYFAGAVDVPGPEVRSIADAAREHGMEVVIGVIERSGSTLYCTALFLGADGSLRGKHRKLVPTALERCVWGRGDGSTLAACQTPLGTLGAAICWENYMPLYRTSLYEQGVDLYCAPTVDDREVWPSTMRHIAVEGRTFVFSACQFLRGPDPDQPPLIRGGSLIVDPLGDILAGPFYDAATILYADIDPGAIARGRFDLDVTGHYARPDLFELRTKT
ncbi:Nitrilase [Planctomycetes bacterium Poly30]|uniref:Nitrilase n=1 Tax=Saltatorellus ferox TaxID=2528018 RepID=A0A518EMH9_9BACT|nr:Nitrilase [Planctomycetes bacterium Poly30]